MLIVARLAQITSSGFPITNRQAALLMAVTIARDDYQQRSVQELCVVPIDRRLVLGMPLLFSMVVIALFAMVLLLCSCGREQHHVPMTGWE